MVVLLFVLNRPVGAELVYFANGGEAQLPATVEGDTVILETPDGAFTFHSSDMRKLVPGHWPEHEWPSRRDEALAGDAEARFRAFWWALEHGLTPEAEAMLRQAHADDPAHEPSARLIRVLDRLAAPLPDPDLDHLHQVLGPRAQVARGPHIVLFHQHSERDAADRVVVLERVVTTYYLWFAAHGFELALPTERLASVWFARQAEFRTYLVSQSAGAFASGRGYFHPTRNLVVAFDGRDAADQRKAREALETGRRQLDHLEATIQRQPHRARFRVELRGEPARTLARAEAETLIDRRRRDLNRQQLLLDLDWRAIDLGTAAHETIHQLVYLSGLASRSQDFPVWLHEGLAAQFEVVRGGRWAGVGRAHDLRLSDWRAARSTPARLAPLLRDEKLTRGYHRLAYAQAWALVFFLRKEHPQEFLNYLDLLRHPSPTHPPGANRALATFQQAFGDDLSRLESQWRREINRLQTPLDTQRP